MATTRRRPTKQHCLLCRLTIACRETFRGILIATGRKVRSIYRHIHSRWPRVIVDAPRREAWQLRRLVRRTARDYARVLDVPLPDGLALIVQRVVFDGRQVNGLLTAFEHDGGKRYVIQLALSVNGHEVSDGELLAVLRHELSAVFAATVGRPILNVALDLKHEIPARSSGSIVDLRPLPSASGNGHDNDAASLSRLTDFTGGEAA